MSVSIAISFPAGRFHATPWGHHVNEGLPEWPPSPWRLLRAIVATWKRKLPGEPLPENHMPAVLADLARQPPQFYLPPATLGHTRHYMPLRHPDQGDRTKVFDAFLVLAPDAEVVFHWPDIAVSSEGRQALELVLSQLGHFGRAESWATARVLPDFDPVRVNCIPGQAPAGQEVVRVLAADPDSWNGWAFQDRKVVKPVPPWNMLADTADLHQEKWSDPPGSKWFSYSRPADAFAPRVPSQVRIPLHSTRYRVARYALDVSHGRRPLPLITDTLPLAEAARTTLLSTFQRLMHRRAYGSTQKPYPELFASQTFAGKDVAGQPLKGHGHAFFLPADEDGDGRIDHVTIFAEGGFTEDEVLALDRLRQLRFGESDPYRLLLVGLAAR